MDNISDIYNAADAQKVSDVYKNLYHYTTWDGLLGILKSKCLWATHGRFLNDFSEFILFKEKLIELLQPHVSEAYLKLINEKPHLREEIIESGGHEHLVHHDTVAMVNAMYNSIGEEIYILSFCGEHTTQHINENGLLSQWRGYGADGGVAIVFDTEQLEEAVICEGGNYEYCYIAIADIVYSEDNEKFRKEFSCDLDILDEDTSKLFDHLRSPHDEPDLNGLYSIINCFSRYKHFGFHEEKEVRIVVMPTAASIIKELAESDGVKLKPEKERNFRTWDNKTIPYIELFNSSEIDLPIKKIIVGPHKEQKARAAALRVMLRDTNIEVSCSDIPFVG
ncbi:MAG: DUF2971 domain-containing protein [Desulfuromonadales bacterium]|nr:DUF2971 domain-containing protein [Desulfuromonadales bacterium]